VGNHGDPESSSPAFTGLIDYFFNSASPIIPEDGRDTTPPAIIDKTPTETNVPVNTQIHVTFSEAMSQTSAESAFSTSATTGSFSWNGNIMTYIPDSDLTFDTTYTVTIGTGAMDLADNNLQTEHIWQFITAVSDTDTKPPTVVRNEPTGTNVPVTMPIHVTFSEAMNQTYAESAFSTSPATTGSFSWNGNIMTYTPDPDLTFNTTYTVAIDTGAKDLADNDLQTEHTWQFTTAVSETDTMPPTVAGNEPTGTNVPVNTPIHVTFNESMDQKSAESAFSTSPATTGSFSWNGNIMTYTPDSVTFDTTYTVTIGTGAVDLSDNNLQTEHTWQFTTEVVQDDDDSSSSGGGGGTSGELYENIACSEIDRQYVYQNSDISYSFELECNIVQYVNFTGLTNAGKIATKVEMLKDTSTLVDNPPSDIVYKNLNTWVGNAGWATKSNIADATVVFTVERSWITENNIDESSIAIYRYSNDNWNKLMTRKIAEDANNLQFEAETSGFSQFAVTGKKLEGEPGGESIFVEPTVTVKKSPGPTTIGEEGIPGFGLFAGFSVLLIAVQLLRKKK